MQIYANTRPEEYRREEKLEGRFSLLCLIVFSLVLAIKEEKQSS
jgi:hypothetical protein